MNIINPFKLVVILTFLLSPIFAKAQVPTVQDCLGAIPICEETYHEDNAYQNTGNYPNEIDNGPSCLGSGEKNDVWYIFTVQASGNLNFSITPNTMSDDYDWAVYNLTNHVCSDIFTTPSIEVSCNYSGTPGITGPNGLGGAQNEAVVPVTAGDIYVINVSQYENNSQDGYTIDFGASTADIYDNVSPEMQSVNAKEYCDSTVITCHFSENILCNTIDVSSFQLFGPGQPFVVVNVESESCQVGAQYGIDFKIHFDKPLRYGSYTLYMPDQAGSGNITDNCGNEATEGYATFLTSGGYDMTLNNQDMPCHDLEEGEIHATIPEASETVWYAFDNGTGTLSTYNPANGDHTGLAAGTYLMSAKVGETIDQYSCRSDTTIIIENPPEAFATVGNDTTLCALPEYILTGITSPVGTGTWTSTSPNVTFTNEHLSNAKAKHIPYGTTTFTWTVDNGICGIFVDELDVTLYPSNTIAGDDNGTCELTTLQLDGNNPFPGTGIWTCNTPTITFDNASLYNATASNISGGSHTFTWTTDYGQCGTLSDEVTISNSSPPTEANILGNDEEICAEQKNLNATPVVVGQGLWTSDENSIIIDNTNSSAQATVIPAGVNHFYWTVSSGFCPPSKDTIIITRYAEPTISNLGADTIICEENTFLQGTPPTIGTGTWTVTNASVIANATLYNSEATLLLGASTFTWTITNGICPPSTDDIIITREASLTQPIAGDDFEVCENYTSLNSNIPSIGTGFWQATGSVIIENSLSNQTNVTNLVNGNNTFIWTIYSPNCPAISDTVIVLSGDFNPPIAQVNDIEAECSVTVPVPTANDACEGTISGTTTSPLFYNQQGTYTINWVFDDGNGNTSNQIQTIRVNDITEPEISCMKDTTVYADTLTENYITNVGALMPAEYSDNCTISSILNDYNNTDSIGIVTFNIGDYVITWTATDANNNEKACEFVYHVIPDERDYADCDNDGIPNYLDEDNCTIIVPEAFSPDGNGKNDVLKIKGLVSYPNHVVTIYNRWGNKVYEASPYNNDWDGHNMFGIGGNEKLPNGTYFYIIETGIEGEKPVTGYIFLIK